MRWHAEREDKTEYIYLNLLKNFTFHNIANVKTKLYSMN